MSIIRNLDDIQDIIFLNDIKQKPKLTKWEQQQKNKVEKKFEILEKWRKRGIILNGQILKNETIRNRYANTWQNTRNNRYYL